MQEGSQMLQDAGQLAVVLYFDDAAEDAVEAIRDRLMARGLIPAPANSVRPHITLAVCTGLDVDQFVPALAQLATETSAFGCTLASVGAFPTAAGVVFLAPTPSHELLNLHEVVLERMLSMGAEISPYFRAGIWVPHCTLALGLQNERMAAAMAACVEAFQPISVQLSELGGVEIGTAQGAGGRSWSWSGGGSHGVSIRPVNQDREHPERADEQADDPDGLQADPEELAALDLQE
jgi:2'-5' RNA ligase